MAGTVRSSAIHRSAVRRSILGALVCVALAASNAQGQVDMSGLWRVETHFSPSLTITRIWNFTQTDTSLTVVDTQPGPPGWTGTIDPLTGSFTLTPSSSTPGPCPADTINAVVNPASSSFSGSLTMYLDVGGCTQGSFAVEGGRCGNGVLDPGETCDDDNITDGDCCSSTCQFDPPSTTCNDGNACTAGEHCDGAGACVGATCQVGPPAMTCNACGQLCTQPQPGVCKCG